MKMITSLFKFISWFFIAESAALLLLIQFKYFSYGQALQNNVMKITLSCGILITLVFLALLQNINTKTKAVFAVLLSLLILFTEVVYLSDLL